jgi:hypothetical protein
VSPPTGRGIGVMHDLCGLIDRSVSTVVVLIITFTM